MKITEYIIIRTVTDTDKDTIEVKVLTGQPFTQRWIDLLRKYIPKQPGFKHKKYVKFS